MARLTEGKVQTHALNYLKKHYNRKSVNGSLFAKEEVRTRKEYGGKRADGLLVFDHWLWGKYVVSMEAKSYKTMPAIRPRLDPYKLMWNSIKAGRVLCLATGSFMALYRMSDGLFQYLVPLNVFIWGALIYGVVTYKSIRHKVVNVVEQVMQYPANEQWLAFSTDSYFDLSETAQMELKKICRFEGVGILLIKPNGKVKPYVKTTTRIKWWGSYTKYYSLRKWLPKEG